MEQCEDAIYVLKDTEIYYDKNKDSLYAFWHPRDIRPTDKNKKYIPQRSKSTDVQSLA
jgi:hypothetical protein